MSKYSPIFSYRKIILIMFFAIMGLSYSAYLNNVPMTVNQPDGTVLNCFATGDEFYNWLHDSDGYTIIQNVNSGYYMYADLVNDELVPTNLKPGFSNPASAGLKPWLILSESKIIAMRKKFDEPAQPRIKGKDNASLQANNKGTINNLSVFIRFADESEFTQSPATYDDAFNNNSNYSLKHYFREVSYNALEINTVFYPTPTTSVISYKDNMPRAFYSPYNATSNPTGYKNDSERTTREMDLLKKAIEYVDDYIPANLDIDYDDDGYVDNICFIVSGTPDPWASLLWPHKWALYVHDVRIHGQRVWEFNFQIQSMFTVSVLCHEMFHTLGAPDLYRYYVSGTPIGSWDLMANNTTPPQQMSAYMKWKYGKWIDNIPEIMESGVYTLNPLASPQQNCFKIRSQASSTEFFVVEYRRKNTYYESAIPGEGLLVYRVNPAYNGNAGGPPDEYYVFRKDGTASNWGNISDATYSSTKNKTKFNHTTNPSPFLTNGSAGAVNISNVGPIGNTISFRVNFMPAVPTLLFPTNNNASVPAKPTFIWAKAKDADMYNFQIASDVNFTNVIYSKDSIIGESLIYPTELPYMNSFYWRVQSITYYDDKSAWSAPNYFTVTPEVPKIIAQSGSVLACKDDEVEISVSAEGRIVKYEWLRDGVVITGMNKSILSFRDINFSQSAVYVARLTNYPGLDTVYSQPISVYIVTDTKIAKEPTSTYATEGSTVFFTFSAHVNGQENNNLIDIKWFIDGKQIVDDAKFAGAKSNILSIKNVNSDIFGKQIKFTITGKCGTTATSNNFTVNKLSIETQTQNFENKVCLNNNGLLNATLLFKNVPTGMELNYKWFKGTEAISVSDKFNGINSNSLTINKMEKTDEADYFLEVRLLPLNALVEVVKFTVTSVEPLKITKAPAATIQAEQDKELKLEIEAESSSDITYQWYKDGVVLNGETNAILLVAKADSKINAGTYYCTLKDDCGTAKSGNFEVQFTIKSSPLSVNEISSLVGFKSYPNPANDYTEITFELKDSAELMITINDILGNVISEISNNNYNSGVYHINFNTSEYPSGMYFLTVKIGDKQLTQKLMIIK